MTGAAIPSSFVSNHWRVIGGASVVAAMLLSGCDDGLPLPEVDGVLWYTETENFGCDAFQEAEGEYLQSQFTHEQPSSNVCSVDRMLSFCRPVAFAAPFTFSDSVSDDPGPWFRDFRQSFSLYDYPGGGSLQTSGSGTIDFTTISLTAGSNIGSGVDVQVGAEWSLNSVLNDRVISAAIDHFQQALSTTATHNFAIEGDYPPRAVVWGEASGEYGGFPFVPGALTSGSFSATGTTTASFTACQEVRLFNAHTQCIYAPNGIAAATQCASGSGVGVHVHEETNNLLLLDRDFRCLTVDDTAAVGGKFPVAGQVCSSGLDEPQQWTWFADGTLRPLSAPTYCLAPNDDAPFTLEFLGGPVTYEPMVVQPCDGGSEETWSFF